MKLLLELSQVLRYTPADRAHAVMQDEACCAEREHATARRYGELLVSNSPAVQRRMPQFQFDSVSAAPPYTQLPCGEGIRLQSENMDPMNDAQDDGTGETEPLVKDGADAAGIGRHSQRFLCPGRPCCARPLTLQEAVDVACQHAKTGDLHNLQAAVVRARSFPEFTMNLSDSGSRTMIYYACLSRKPDVVEWLLEQHDYLPDDDYNKNAYGAISASSSDDVNSDDPGEKTAALMKKYGYNGSGTPVARSPRSSGSHIEPQTEDGATNQPRRCCPVTCWQQNYERLKCAGQGDQDDYVGPDYGKLTEDSKRTIGHQASFRREAPAPQGKPNATTKIIQHLDALPMREKHRLHSAKGEQLVTVRVNVTGYEQEKEQEFLLSPEMCRFERQERGTSTPPRQEFWDATFHDDREWEDDMISYTVKAIGLVSSRDQMESDPELESEEYRLVVGQKTTNLDTDQEGLYFFSPDKRKVEMCALYMHFSCDSQGRAAIIRKGRTFKLKLAYPDGEWEDREYEANDAQEAEAICYYVRLGFSAWHTRGATAAGNDRNIWVKGIASAAHILDVDTTRCGRCQQAYSSEKCKELCVGAKTLVKQCCNRFSAFFKADVHPDYTTPTCVWLWIFSLQIVSHVLCPFLVFWSRTRKHYEMSTQLVLERFAVLFIRWLVVGGTLCCYALGYLPSMAKSEPTINALMWLFIVVTHSAHEASLVEEPDVHNDTFSAWKHHQSRHVSNVSDQQGCGNHQIEHELHHFLRRKGQSRQGKFSHRMTERRLHELHAADMKIDNAHFESFHSEDLSKDVSSTTGANRDFDEVITKLQLFLPKNWCLNARLGEHLNEDVVPDSIRKAIAMVRMHIKDLRRQHYLATRDNAAYALEVEQLAEQAAQWEMTGEDNEQLQEEGASRSNCVLRRKDLHRSYTESSLQKWDQFADRVMESLSDNQDDQYGLCLTSAKLFGLMAFSASLVVLWIWLGHQLSRHIYTWAHIECTDMNCMMWSLAAVLAMVFIICAGLYTCNSCQRRAQALKTVTYSTDFIGELEDFVEEWDCWETRRIERQTRLLEEVMPDVARMPEPMPEPKSEQEQEQDAVEEEGLLDMFGDDEEWDDTAEPEFETPLQLEPELEPEPEAEPEPEPEPEPDPELEPASVIIDASHDLYLARLTALCADKLHVDVNRDARSAWWIDISTQDIDQLTLELSRVDDKHRDTILHNWCDLRKSEIMLKSKIMLENEQEDTTRENDELTKTTTGIKKFEISNIKKAWRQMVDRRVARESKIIKLRARLIASVRNNIETDHGASRDVGGHQETDIEKQTDLTGAYKKDKLQASIVAESILALAHMQSKKLYKLHLWWIMGFCALDALCHPVLDAVSTWLNVPCEEDISFRCLPLENATYGSWLSQLADEETPLGSCSDISYNETQDRPCGVDCGFEAKTFFSCTPKAYEVLIRIISSLIGATLMFSIVSDLAEVIRGYEMRFCAIQYFSQLTPNQGSLTHRRKQHFGLLPTFEFTTKRNIIVWNRIRAFLQTYDQHNFSISQHKITWVLLIPVAFLLFKLYLYISEDSVALVAQDHQGAWFEHLLHVDPTPALVDTLIVKAILMQFLGSCLIGHMLYIGVQTTQLHEHDIPHLLLLKKAEITAGEIVPVVNAVPLPSLFYSNQKEIVLWCKYQRGEVNGNEELKEFVRRKVHGIKPQVEDIMGIPTDDFGGLGISVRNHRDAPEEGGHVSASANFSNKRTRSAAVRPRAGSAGRDDEESWLRLLITVNDGHDLFVDVHDLNADTLDKNEHNTLQIAKRGNDDVVIVEVRDIGRSEEDSDGNDQRNNLSRYRSRIPLHLSHPSNEEAVLMMHLCKDNAVVQLTSLLDSLIRVIDEERRFPTHAPTIEDTRPALNLPSCCFDYRIGLTTTLFGTVMAMLATTLFSLGKSILA